MSTDTYIQQRNESNRKARAFLQEVLAGGPQTYQIVHEQAVKQGISKVTVQVVKTGITPQRTLSDGFREARTEPLHPAGRLHMRR